MRPIARTPPIESEALPAPLDRAGLLDEVLTTFRSPTYVPPVVPVTAFELLQLARKPETRFDDITRVCERDPMVAARVLRLAQSAFFTRGARVVSLREALVRVGVSALVQMFLEATLTMRVFRAPGYDAQMVSLRRHSSVVAYLARTIAPSMRGDPEQAFTCGLLHDVGAAAAAYVVGKRVPFELPWSVIVDVHAEAGRIVCRSWGLPAEIEAVVGAHHLGRSQGSLLPLACATGVAEWIAARAGLGLDGEAMRVRPDVELRLCGLDDAGLEVLVVDARRHAASLG